MAATGKIKQWIKWFTLISGFMSSLFFLLFIIGEGIWALIDGKSGVIPIMVLVSSAIAGYGIALFRPRAGGLMMVVSAIAMAVYLLIVGSRGEILMASVYSLPFLVPGILFMRFRAGIR
jgi:hypothetical protein